MPSPAIQAIELSEDERERLQGIVRTEVQFRMNGSNLDAGDIDGTPWALHVSGLLEEEAAIEECRLRVDVVCDAVALLDQIGWGERGGNWVTFYPASVRALRFCRRVLDRRVGEGFEQEDGVEDLELLDRLLAVADGD
jgi:hypothetical protein